MAKRTDSKRKTTITRGKNPPYIVLKLTRKQAEQLKSLVALPHLDGLPEWPITGVIQKKLTKLGVDYDFIEK